MASHRNKPPRAKWGDNVILADFGARRRESNQEDPPAAAKIPTETEGWAAAQIMEGLAEQSDSGRLFRGREYYRAGRVISIELETNTAVGLVNGSQMVPFEVTLKAAAVSKKDREFLVAELHSNPGLLRTILSGQAPPNHIADRLLRPDRLRLPQCSCPDPHPVCKHAIAVGYVLAARFNRDAATMLQWRGIDASEALQELARIDEARGAASLNSLPPTEEHGGEHSAEHHGDEGVEQRSEAEPAAIDQEEFWGSEDRRVQWDPLRVESGLLQGNKDSLMEALRSVSWTSVDQLQTHYELEVCYEAITDDSGRFRGRPWDEDENE